LVLPTKKPEKLSEIWKKFLTFENSSDFSKYVPIKNSEEMFTEILPASSTKKNLTENFLISKKNL
jgi:hypothetical protein